MSFSDLIKKSLALVEKHEKGENKVKKDNEKTLTQFLEWETLSTQTQYQYVSKEVEKNWHFPTLFGMEKIGLACWHFFGIFYCCLAWRRKNGPFGSILVYFE